MAALSLPAIAAPADAATVRPASLTATFTDHVIPAGSTTVLTFAVVNREGSDDLHGLSFTQPLPRNLQVTAYGPRLGCGQPTVTGVDTLRVKGIDVAKRAVCTVEVTVVATADGVFAVSPRENARTGVGHLTPGQGDVLRVESQAVCRSLIAGTCPPAG